MTCSQDRSGRDRARTRPRVNRLVTINPPTEAVGRSGEVLQERARMADQLGMRGVVDLALVRSYPEHLRTDQDAYEQYVARFITNDPTSYAHILRALTKVDFSGLLERIRCPTLFVSGRHDLVRLAADIAVISKRVDGAGFLEIEGGHIPSVQAPGAVAQTLHTFFDW